jgi:hypothetical protein
MKGSPVKLRTTSATILALLGTIDKEKAASVICDVADRHTNPHLSQIGRSRRSEAAGCQRQWATNTDRRCSDPSLPRLVAD